MGVAAALVLLYTGGAVRLLVVMYSINVFLTFTLTQLGMVRHWWNDAAPAAALAAAPDRRDASARS